MIFAGIKQLDSDLQLEKPVNIHLFVPNHRWKYSEIWFQICVEHFYDASIRFSSKNRRCWWQESFWCPGIVTNHWSVQHITSIQQCILEQNRDWSMNHRNFGTCFKTFKLKVQAVFYFFGFIYRWGAWRSGTTRPTFVSIQLSSH